MLNCLESTLYML